MCITTKQVILFAIGYVLYVFFRSFFQAMWEDIRK